MAAVQNPDFVTFIDVVYKIGTPVCLALLFFLKNTFVSKTEYTATMEKFATELQNLRISLASLVNAQIIITDHEQRIRVLEKVNLSA